MKQFFIYKGARPMLCPCMALAERFSRFYKKAEAFKIFLTQRAVKTL